MNKISATQLVNIERYKKKEICDNNKQIQMRHSRGTRLFMDIARHSIKHRCIIIRSMTTFQFQFCYHHLLRIQVI